MPNKKMCFSERPGRESLPKISRSTFYVLMFIVPSFSVARKSAEENETIASIHPCAKLESLCGNSESVQRNDGQPWKKQPTDTRHGTIHAIVLGKKCCSSYSSRCSRDRSTADWHSGNRGSIFFFAPGVLKGSYVGVPIYSCEYVGHFFCLVPLKKKKKTRLIYE